MMKTLLWVPAEGFDRIVTWPRSAPPPPTPPPPHPRPQYQPHNHPPTCAPTHAPPHSCPPAGRAEALRLALAAKEVDFDFQPVNYESMKSDLEHYPFAQVPRCAPGLLGGMQVVCVVLCCAEGGWVGCLCVWEFVQASTSPPPLQSTTSLRA